MGAQKPSSVRLERFGISDQTRSDLPLSPTFSTITAYSRIIIHDMLQRFTIKERIKIGSLVVKQIGDCYEENGQRTK